MMPLIAAIAGAAGAVIWLGGQAATPNAQADRRDLIRVDDCTISIVLVASDGSPVSDAIDRNSGRGGFSHCYVDPCRHDEHGRRWIVDYAPGHGVHWAHADTYAERGRATVWLPGSPGDELFGCIRSRIGDFFEVAPILAGVPNPRNCSGLVVGCLPWAIRRRLELPRPVAPNDLAALFGVRVGGAVIYRGGNHA